MYNYFKKLLRHGAGLDINSVTCRYGKFIMHCLMGPEENILQLTFAIEKHEWLMRYLKNLNSKVHIIEIAQKKFRLNTMLADYFSGRLTKFPVTVDSPLLAAGTDFQQNVWRHIAKIPYGSSITYKELAELAGSPKGSRAAGAACGANPVSLLIPCHRVVAQKGLGGFAGGVLIKENLLALEQSVSNSAN